MIRIGYLPRCSANLRGAHILGNTIGNLVAGGIASAGKSKATGKPIDLLAEVKDGSHSSAEVADVGPAVNDVPAAPEEAAEIVVTAQRGVRQFRSYVTTLPIAQQELVRKGLTQGTPAPEFIVPRQSSVVPGYGDIPGGSSNPDKTLAGAINEFAFFTAGTEDDLGGWLFKANMLDRSDDGIVNMIERLAWETEGNDGMLAGNISALHATGDPTLAAVAQGLEAEAAARWRNYGAAATAQADKAVEDIVRVNPVFDDLFLARDAIQGKASGKDIAITLAGHGVGVIGVLGGRVLKAESRIERAVRVGKEGENLAGLVGRKVGVLIGSTGRYRFPDHIDEVGKVITEVKNVKYQGWTKQLKDYAEYSSGNGYAFVLKLRQGATQSRELIKAENRGDVIIEWLR